MNAFTTVDMTVVSPHDIVKTAMAFLRSPAVEVAATLFTIGYPLGVVWTLRRDATLTAREWRRFRRGAEVGAWIGFLVQQFLCYALVLLEYETSTTLLGAMVGAVIYSPAVVPILSMVCLILVTCPLAVKTHISLNLYWIGALCTALVQQGLWMALSLVFYFSGNNELNVEYASAAQSPADYSHMGWVVILGSVPLILMKALRRRELNKIDGDSDNASSQEEPLINDVEGGLKQKEIAVAEDGEEESVSTEGDASSYASSSSEEDEVFLMEDNDRAFLHYQRLV